MRKITFNMAVSTGTFKPLEAWLTPLSPYLVVHELIPDHGPGWTVSHLLSGMSATAGHKVSSPEEAVKLLEDLVATGIDWSRLDPTASIKTLRDTPAVVGFLEKLYQLEVFSTVHRIPVKQINEVEV